MCAVVVMIKKVLVEIKNEKFQKLTPLNPMNIIFITHENGNTKRAEFLKGGTPLTVDSLYGGSLRVQVNCLQRCFLHNRCLNTFLILGSFLSIHFSDELVVVVKVSQNGQLGGHSLAGEMTCSDENIFIAFEKRTKDCRLKTAKGSVSVNLRRKVLLVGFVFQDG